MKVGVYMFTIKSLSNYDYIPTDTYYNNDDWYINTSPLIKQILTRLYGKREIQIDESLIIEYRDKIKDKTFISEILVPEINDDIDTLFKINRDKYRHIYDSLNEEYNPLWNVDGSETLTYTKSNTGTQDITTTDTGTIKSITKNTGTVNDKGTMGGTVTEANTSYDSNTFYDSKRQTNNITNDNTRTDNTTADSTQTNNLSGGNNRVDNLTETYSETKTRGGNIGVTMSQQLLTAEIDLREKYNFTEMLCHDIANTISYSVY